MGQDRRWRSVSIGVGYPGSGDLCPDGFTVRPDGYQVVTTGLQVSKRKSVYTTAIFPPGSSFQRPSCPSPSS
jgi:hypothetical protein